ncbi:YitT family protein [Demequina zhanjiangensis]|uniref:YitT family protein n=1 Tax=Demequina zhanjiangensis TaxID=3051659 RepID=A0ABT8G2B8_9MICO|nr:YitT family protein [Demequina sp. SYSU T00b26]MDN4473273.1 YitT family protein [Demequina sp. SYSU T00b26]
MTVIEPPLEVKKHALWEDALALVVGAFMMSWGIYLLGAIDGVSGGLAGVAFLTTYLSGWSFGVVYFVINLPFYYLAVKRLGWTFTVKTLIAVALVSVGSSLHPHFIDIGQLSPMYAAIFAGLSIGMGMLVLFRHGSSAGGFGILAAYAQERFNIRAGYVQGALDVTVVIASLALVDPWILLCSIIGAVLLNFVIAINHRPGRYFG